MIRALPTNIRLSNGETQSVLWGLPEKSKQRETMMVGHKLKHQTAVDVSIGNYMFSLFHLLDSFNIHYILWFKTICK